jgi:SAM-dependent methyltransferase
MTSGETYTPGYTETATALMARRTLASHAAFLRPYLRSGLSVLDVGCGPGSITLEIAAAVAPGKVIGIDRDAGQVELARAAATELGRPNASFGPASVYELPFPDGSFDLVFAHAVFEHLQAPAQALGEITRVLRPGGHVALRSPDWGGFVVGPRSDDLDAAIAAYRDLQTRNGGDVFIGRRLGALLRSAGFGDLALSATYEIYPSAEIIGEYLAHTLDAAGETGHAAVLRSWMADPNAIFAQAWFEAVGTR